MSQAPRIISNLETARLLGRALRYVAPVRGRFGGKAALTLLSLIPMIVFPWPLKVLTDQVVLRKPLDTVTGDYPGFLMPLLVPLEGLTPEEILFWIAVAFALLLIVVGGFGTTGPERDITSGSLASGQDTATTTENQANIGWSFASGLFGLFEFRWTIRLSQALNHHYRSRLFKRVQSLPMSSFDDEHIGDAMYRVMYDTPSITGMAYDLLLTPVVAPLQIALIVWVLGSTYSEHPLVAWIAFGFTPVVLAVSLPFAGLVRRRAGVSRGAGATTASTIEEGVSNVLAVQSLGGTRRERERFDRDSWRSFGAYRSYVLAGILAYLASTAAGAGLSIWAFLYITDLVIAGSLSPGDFIVLISYFFQIVGSTTRIGALWLRVQNNAAGLQRVFEFMDLPSERDAPGARPLAPISRGIELEQVSYSYPDGTVALREVNLGFKVGRVTALVGPAGAGKTTLAYLIPRFLEPTVGRVLADGNDLRTVTAQSLRAQVAFVFQETALFDASIAENIRIGNLDAGEAEVRRAAEIAGAHEFIERLPQGYETRLGRGGGKLSVGQKQRLAIARALVRDGRVLILDEPTSALDPETEMRLVEALREASRERAVIVIAHRLSTIREADEIAFLADGRILECGSHDELMRLPRGAYRRFVSLQTRGAA